MLDILLRRVVEMKIVKLINYKIHIYINIKIITSKSKNDAADVVYYL